MSPKLGTNHHFVLQYVYLRILYRLRLGLGSGVSYPAPVADQSQQVASHTCMY